MHKLNKNYIFIFFREIDTHLLWLWIGKLQRQVPRKVHYIHLFGFQLYPCQKLEGTKYQTVGYVTFLAIPKFKFLLLVFPWKWCRLKIPELEVHLGMFQLVTMHNNYFHHLSNLEYCHNANAVKKLFSSIVNKQLKIY